ncbi:phosphopantetheinyl transferase [Cryomyces antarcticus]|uniref:holo-[acyl-carrier-protein] synthase n=1 Tax=Cryomyces antarcticus TaxID=329879 RepID=A0ABR0LQ40_9PEZI|nr:hypothetical protein LTR39_001749 [Cryomyces antarcticus]KAK5201722.1 hypothetical protein LTR16_001704 [Cryomyces antarcticus]
MPLLTRWLLDTRALWPGTSIEQAAPSALALLSPTEQHEVRRKVYIQDARMSLGSALLKRAYISQTLGIPWRDIKLGRQGDPKHGKPCYVPPDGSPSPIDFNVSHQAGLVTLVGCDNRSGSRVYVGADIVCVNERDDYRTIDADGFDGWVDIYGEVFGEEERWDMKYNVAPDVVRLLDGTEVGGDELGRHDRVCRREQQCKIRAKDGVEKTVSGELIVEAKLRRFYAFFCYKEAYIKLEGEALLADWLRELEFKNVRAPRAGTVARCSTHGTWGERVEDVEVWLKGVRVEDTKMELQAFEENFMLGTAVKMGRNVQIDELAAWKKLSLELDVLACASV